MYFPVLDGFWSARRPAAAPKGGIPVKLRVVSLFCALLLTVSLLAGCAAAPASVADTTPEPTPAAESTPEPTPEPPPQPSPTPVPKTPRQIQKEYKLGGTSVAAVVIYLLVYLALVVGLYWLMGPGRDAAVNALMSAFVM